MIIDTDGGEHGLVNAIGAYKGTTWLNTYPDQPVKQRDDPRGRGLDGNDRGPAKPALGGGWCGVVGQG